MQYVRRSDLNFKLNNLENKIELLEKEKNDALAQGLVLSYDLSEWKREVVELCEYIGVSMYDCKDESEMLKKAYRELDKRLMPKSRPVVLCKIGRGLRKDVMRVFRS